MQLPMMRKIYYKIPEWLQVVSCSEQVHRFPLQLIYGVHVTDTVVCAFIFKCHMVSGHTQHDICYGTYSPECLRGL